MSDKVYNVLFLCTGNSARSIMAEAVLNTLGNERFHAYSAGSQPNGTVNRFTLDVLKSANIPVTGVRSKSWDEFASPQTPHMDFIITLCDSAAGEECPLWPGQPVTAHWGFEDPSAFVGTDEQKHNVFNKALRQITNRIRIFSSLPIATLDRAAIQHELKTIGKHSTQ